MQRTIDFIVVALFMVLIAALSYYFSIKKSFELFEANRRDILIVDVQKVMNQVQEVCRDSGDVQACMKNNLEKVDKKIQSFDNGRNLILISKVVLSQSNVSDITKDVISVISK